MCRKPRERKQRPGTDNKNHYMDYEENIDTTDDHKECADGESQLTGIGPGAVDGTHPSTYTPENLSHHIIEDKTKQPGE